MGNTPAKSARTRRPGENGFNYRSQFGLLVPCKDEAEQKRRYARLTKLGMSPKVVVV